MNLPPEVVKLIDDEANDKFGTTEQFRYANEGYKIGATTWASRAQILKELLIEIDKSLYLGEDLNDKEILEWYIEVTKTIKQEIKSALSQFLTPETKTE